MNTFKCDQCGNGIGSGNGIGTSYGECKGRKICYSCCGENDRKNMVETGRATLYLTTGKQKAFGMVREETAPSKVSNWPGTLSFPCYVRRGAHNIARYRYDVWFTGPDGKQWHGVTYGDNTQICHCKRTKGK